MDGDRSREGKSLWHTQKAQRRDKDNKGRKDKERGKEGCLKKKGKGEKPGTKKKAQEARESHKEGTEGKEKADKKD